MSIANRLSRQAACLSIAAVTGFALVGCGASGAGSAGGKSGSGTGDLVIGASVSLTGDFSDSGKAIERGYQLWANTVNARGGILGRKVKLDIVDDASNPMQVVTNYENLINKDGVNLTFGPFSTLLTVPAAQVARRYSYAFLAPAGGGPKVFAEHLNNFFFVQPAPVVNAGDAFVKFVLSLPASQRPKTAAYAELDDPFSAPVAENIRQQLEKAGIKTVYKQVYPSETADLTPVMAAVAALKPDLIVGGTQSQDAYAQVKALVQLKFSPKLMFQANGANSPVDFPNNVGASNTAGVMGSADWFPGSTAPGSAEFTAAYIKAYGGDANHVDDNSAEAYAVGQLVEDVAKKTGKIDNATLISSLHSGTWPTLLGNLSWDSSGAPQGEFNIVQWQHGTLIPIFPSSVAKATAIVPKPNWGQ